VRPSSGDTKASRKEERAEDKAAKKSESKTDKSSADPQTVVAVAPVPAATPVRAVATPQVVDAEFDDTQVVEQAVAAAASPKAVTTQPAKAAPVLKDIPDADTQAPADMRENTATAADQNAPAKEVSKQAMDKIIALAKNDVQQPAPSIVPQTAPRVVQTLAANVTAMLNAVRGTMTVTSPKPVASLNTDAKSDAAPVDKLAQPAQTLQSASTGKSAQNSQNDGRDASRDQDRPVSDDAAKADVSAADPKVAPPAPATSAPQPAAAPATQVAVAATPNAVNPTAPAQTGPAPHPSSTASQRDTSSTIPALAAAIAAKSAAGTKTFDIRMDPPELGRVDVHLSVDRDGKVQATISADQPQTLALLQKDSHNLERSLKDAGLDLSNNSLNFSLKGEGRQGDGGGASMARARSLPDAVVARAEAANASASHFNHASGDGRLDIRV
jgi:chemotaxis protein MotD